MKERHARGFKEFKAYYVDKPIMDFVRVYQIHPAFGGDSRKHTDTSTPMDFQRQGIGTALYREASRWMQDLGLKLYASGCQTDEARAVWAAFTDKGWVATDKARLNGGAVVRRYLTVEATADTRQAA